MIGASFTGQIHAIHPTGSVKADGELDVQMPACKKTPAGPQFFGLPTDCGMKE